MTGYVRFAFNKESFVIRLVRFSNETVEFITLDRLVAASYSFALRPYALCIYSRVKSKEKALRYDIFSINQCH